MTAEKQKSQTGITDNIKERHIRIIETDIGEFSKFISAYELNSKLLAYFEKEKAELEKGCKRTLMQYPFVEQPDRCGEMLNGIVYICPTCQAKLAQLQKDCLNILGRTI